MYNDLPAQPPAALVLDVIGIDTSIPKSLYLNDKIPYYKILTYIFKKIDLFNEFKHKKLRNFKDILKFIDSINLSLNKK